MAAANLFGLRRYWFIFTELVKRDYKKRYKRTVLGMGWSVLSPLLTLLIMRMIFIRFFGRTTPHYTVYLFCGTLLFAFFREATTGGMFSLISNKGILLKVDVPKWLFLLSKNVTAVINFGLSLGLFFVFAGLDGIAFSWRFVRLSYPILCLIVFSIGVGMVLSALMVFFRDIKYLYDLLLLLLNYLSVIFYSIDDWEPAVQRLFLFNPLYCYIRFFRLVVIKGVTPSPAFHLLCLGWAVGALALGGWLYRRLNYKFVYFL